MIRNSLITQCMVVPDFNFPFKKQVLKKRGVMHHFVVATQIRIFIFQRVEAMRTSSYNFLHAIIIHGADVVKSLHLEKKFVACPFRRITVTAFLYTQYGKFY